MTGETPDFAARWSRIDRHHSRDLSVTRYVFQPLSRPGIAEGVARTIHVSREHQSLRVLQIGISSQIGCAVSCRFCNYGERFFGQLDAHEIESQACLIADEHRPVAAQGALTEYAFFGGGEPMHNFPAVERAIHRIHARDGAARITFSTSCPARAPNQYRRLMDLGRTIPALHLQLSGHATENRTRRRIIPSPTLTVERIAELGEDWLAVTGRKPELAFAAADHYGRRDWPTVQALALVNLFAPARWQVKITPIFPFEDTKAHHADSVNDAHRLFDAVKAAGFDDATLYNPEQGWEIGANCGQFPAFQDFVRTTRDLRSGSR